MSVSLRRADKEDFAADLASLYGAHSPLGATSGGQVLCLVRRSKTATQVHYVVHRLAPLGLLLRRAQEALLPAGDAVEVTLTVQGRTVRYRGMVVAPAVVQDKLSLVAIRLDTTPRQSGAGERAERQSVGSYVCHRLFCPIGVGKNTGRFDDLVHFRVADLSALGMRVTTDFSMALLPAGSALSVRLLLPTVGEVELKATVIFARAQAGGADHSTLIALRYVRPSAQALYAIGQYLLQFGDDGQACPDAEALARSGFFPPGVPSGYAFDVVRSDADYRAALALRATNAAALSRQRATKPASACASAFDAQARIVLAKEDGRIVGTVAVSLHEEGELFEAEATARLPENFPKRALVVEASRAAIAQPLAGGRLAVDLLRHVVVLTLLSGRRYCLHTVPVQQKAQHQQMGFKLLNVDLGPPPPQQEAARLLMLDVQSLLESKTYSPLLYVAIVPSIKRLLTMNKNIRLGWMTRQRLRVLEWLSPLYRLRERYRAANRQLVGREGGQTG